MDLPRAIIIFVISATAILVGLPLWWNTTKVYRASLPFSDISSLKNAELKSTAALRLKIGPNLAARSSSMPQTLKKHLVQQLMQNPTLSDYEFKVGVTENLHCQNCKEKLSEVWQKKTLLSEYVNDFDDCLNKEDTGLNKYHLGYQVYIFSVGSKGHLLGSEPCQVFVGKLRNLIFFCKDGLSEASYADEIASILEQGYIPELNPRFTKSKATPKVPQATSSIQSAPGYQLSFILANANPHDFIPSWDIKDAIKTYLHQFLSKVSFLGPFSVTSQVLHFVDVGIKPRKTINGNFYSNDQLGLLINPIESRLGSYTSNNPVLHFVIYLPSKAEMPLSIGRGGKEKLYSFSSPRWGGMYFYNINSQHNTSAPVKVNINMNTVMSVFVSQLKGHLGIKSQTESNVIYSTLNGINIADWELNLLLIKRTIENLKKSTSTLLSLAELLEQIANIVISNEVKDLIESAVQSIRDTKQKLKEGHILDAFNTSKIAFVNSEKAFYDPSLLALLYFPDDQKYAIYMPLFLPISVPIVLSLIGALKWIKGQSSKKVKDA